MSVQLLISALEIKNYEDFLEKMNVQTDAIIINQCDRHSYKTIDYRNNKIDIYEFAERGVGLSRNMALMRAKADYCLITDDDMIYVDGYEKIVEGAFAQNKDADVIIFNLINCENRFKIKKKFNVGAFNYGRFGAARLAIRCSSIRKKEISFNLCFGGGAMYGAGEDCIFLRDCVKNGLKLVAVPISIAALDEESESTWFKGYNEKFFFDKGALFYVLSNKYAKLLCLRNLIKNRSLYKQSSITLRDAYSLMKKGINAFVSDLSYNDYDNKEK